MIHVQRGRELGAGAGAGVAGARGGGAGATPLYTDNLQRVSTNSHEHGEPVADGADRTFKAADRHEHGHLDRCTPSGAALAERAERTDRAHPRRRPYDVLHVPSRLLPARAPWIICGKNRRWG